MRCVKRGQPAHLDPRQDRAFPASPRPGLVTPRRSRPSDPARSSRRSAKDWGSTDQRGFAVVAMCAMRDSPWHGRSTCTAAPRGATRIVASGADPSHAAEEGEIGRQGRASLASAAARRPVGSSAWRGTIHTVASARRPAKCGTSGPPSTHGLSGTRSCAPRPTAGGSPGGAIRRPANRPTFRPRSSLERDGASVARGSGLKGVSTASMASAFAGGVGRCRFDQLSFRVLLVAHLWRRGVDRSVRGHERMLRGGRKRVGQFGSNPAYRGFGQMDFVCESTQA